MAQQSPDIGADKVSTQPTQYAASYNIGTVLSRSLAAFYA